MNETKICSYCGETILKVAKKCKHCGEWLEEKPNTGPTSIQNPETLIRQALGDKYEILGVIGKGGMATVYKALQKNLNREVALKVIHQNLVHDTEFVSRFIREAQVSASLNHPNIVTVYDVGSIGSVHYMAMELLEGEDLHQKVKQQGALNHNNVVKWMIPVAEALNYIHEKGLIHRDIKSSNILITKQGRPVLMDFGIAHAADGTKLTQTGTVIGTPEYMSPEQAQGHDMDNRSDLYSLGVVMYECLTGKVPFKGDNPLTTIHKVIYEEPKIISRQNWLGSVVQKLLAKEPKQRFKTGAALASALQNQLKVVAPIPETQSNAGKTQKIKTSPPRKNNLNEEKPKEKNRQGKGLKWAIALVTAFIIIIIIIGININNNRQERIRLAAAEAKQQEELAQQRKAEAAKKEQQRKQAAQKQSILQKYGMVKVNGGTFKMGSNESSDEKPIHSVTVSSFYISKYECTQQLWQEIMNSNPSSFIGSNHPVEVTWYDAQTFIKKLNKQTDMDFRLPTEAEWEFAARGGYNNYINTYSGSNSVSRVAWYNKNSFYKGQHHPDFGTHPVGKKQANELGLYDMSGNVMEWCNDWYDKDYYSSSPQQNPCGPSSGSRRVGRGGSWRHYSGYCQVARRYDHVPFRGFNYMGFRLAHSLP